MLLAIDAGNTNTLFAIYDGDRLVNNWRCRTAASRTADEYASFLHELMLIDDMRWDQISTILIGSVVPEVNFNLTRFCQKYLNKEPTFISAENAGIDVDLPMPSEVGADRLVNAVSVVKHYQSPAVVVDFGTATTFDVIDQNGAYSGGVIAPGINLSITALHQAASKLPKVSVKKPDTTIGKTTSHAIQSGIYWGYLGLIEGVIKNITDELGTKPYVIATGGLASLFTPNTDAIDIVDEELTLKGLLEIYKKLS